MIPYKDVALQPMLSKMIRHNYELFNTTKNKVHKCDPKQKDAKQELSCMFCCLVMPLTLLSLLACSAPFDIFTFSTPLFLISQLALLPPDS